MHYFTRIGLWPTEESPHRLQNVASPVTRWQSPRLVTLCTSGRHSRLGEGHSGTLGSSSFLKHTVHTSSLSLTMQPRLAVPSHRATSQRAPYTAGHLSGRSVTLRHKSECHLHCRFLLHRRFFQYCVLAPSLVTARLRPRHATLQLQGTGPWCGLCAPHASHLLWTSSLERQLPRVSHATGCGQKYRGSRIQPLTRGPEADETKTISVLTVALLRHACVLLS